MILAQTPRLRETSLYYKVLLHVLIQSSFICNNKELREEHDDGFRAFDNNLTTTHVLPSLKEKLPETP